MLKSVLAASIVAAALSAVPASAMITVFSGPGAVQPDENVLFQGAPPSGLNAFGVTNQSNTLVTFTGIEPLNTPPQGQARITGADGGISKLSFALNPDLGFTAVEFNIFGTGATATEVMLNFTDQFGTDFGGTYQIGNGQNFFSALASDNQFITNVSLMLNGTVQDLRQFRIGGIGQIDGGENPGGVIPEPASWAMMMAGFGLVGGAMRRRQRQHFVNA
jgi:hypothetical protein